MGNGSGWWVGIGVLRIPGQGRSVAVILLAGGGRLYRVRFLEDSFSRFRIVYLVTLVPSMCSGIYSFSRFVGPEQFLHSSP